MFKAEEDDDSANPIDSIKVILDTVLKKIDNQYEKWKNKMRDE